MKFYKFISIFDTLIMNNEKTGFNSLNKEKISRRSFIGSIISVWGTVLTLPFIYGIVEFLTPPGKKFKSYKNKLLNIQENTTILLYDLPENTSKFIRIDDEPVLVIRREELNIIAFSALCTHLDCIVGYRHFEKDIICNCHRSVFNLDGFPQNGPAKEPLIKYQITIKGDKIIINNNRI